jgi:hypothetical protein
MNKKIIFLENVKERIENLKKEKAAKRLLVKKDIINSITRPWTQEEIDSYHNSLLMTSVFFIINNYSEKECKLSILRHNRNLFTPHEYCELYNTICHTKIINKI